MTAADSRLRGDERVYVGLAPAGGSVLELGCGTGRLTAALAEQGLTVLGVDIAPAMLNQARARVASLAPDVAHRITLRQADMTALSQPQTFDLVICPFFTLAHVPAGAAWSNTFAVAARHLKPDGRAAFHLPRLEVMRLPGPRDPSVAVMDQALPDGRRLRLYVRERSFREGINRLDQVLEYAVADPAGRLVARSPERLTYYMTDPKALAARAGLVLDAPPVDVGGVGDIWVFRRASP